MLTTNAIKLKSLEAVINKTLARQSFFRKLCDKLKPAQNICEAGSVRKLTGKSGKRPVIVPDLVKARN